MTRAQLEHIVRAAGAITNEQAIVVLGSQSILGSFEAPPDSLTVSREADVCPLHAAQKADLISGAIGEVSQFDSTFGYYAHGLPPESCPLPLGWDQRLVVLQNENTRGVTALCLHPLDLACSKLVAGRDKDKEFVAEMLGHGLVHMHAIQEQIGLLPENDQRRTARENLAIVQARVRVAARVAENPRPTAKISPPIEPLRNGPRMSM